ncbi:MAG: BamA/TamA family outer membrane protein [Pseudomonadota bacterium]
MYPPARIGMAILMVLLVLLSDKVLGGAETAVVDIVEEAQEGSATSSSKGNFVAVPIPFSNPTIGTGVNAALLYLHSKRPGDDRSPNATSGLGVMYSDTDSWGAGVFHDDAWGNDRFRFTGFAGYGEFNLKYYGVGDNPILARNPIDYGFKISVIAPQFQVRIPGTDHWFAGIHYLYLDSDSVFQLSEFLPWLPEIRGRIRTAGIGPAASYDSRDNKYYPTRGQNAQIKWTDYAQQWGGDFDYRKLLMFVNHYQPVGNSTVVALRARTETVSGSAPFFDLPYLDMRGFARGRYRDDLTLSLHTEVRHKFLPRWGAVAFVEAGWFGDDLHDITSNKTILSYGGGIRWQLTEEQPLNIGLDLAVSSDDYTVLVQVGEKF